MNIWYDNLKKDALLPNGDILLYTEKEEILLNNDNIIYMQLPLWAQETLEGAKQEGLVLEWHDDYCFEGVLPDVKLIKDKIYKLNPNYSNIIPDNDYSIRHEKFNI